MARQALFLLITVAVFGIWLPLTKGFAFLDPIFLLGYSCIGMFFVSPNATAVFDPAPKPAAVLQRIGWLVFFGYAISAMLLLAGLVTVNLQNWHGKALLPGTKLLISAQLLSLSACFGVVALSGTLSRQFGPKTAISIVRLGFLSLLLMLVFGYGRISDSLRASIEESLTNAGLTLFAFRATAVLSLLGLVLTGWHLLRMARNPAPVD